MSNPILTPTGLLPTMRAAVIIAVLSSFSSLFWPGLWVVIIGLAAYAATVAVAERNRLSHNASTSRSFAYASGIAFAACLLSMWMFAGG